MMKIESFNIAPIENSDIRHHAPSVRLATYWRWKFSFIYLIFTD